MPATKMICAFRNGRFLRPTILNNIKTASPKPIEERVKSKDVRLSSVVIADVNPNRKEFTNSISKIPILPSSINAYPNLSVIALIIAKPQKMSKNCCGKPISAQKKVGNVLVMAKGFIAEHQQKTHGNQ